MLSGEPDTTAFGSISNGVFEGQIISPKVGSYYVEKAHHYFPLSQYPNRTFHSVIYHDEHVQYPHKSDHPGHVGGCGITDEVIQWMDRIQNSAVDDDVEVQKVPQPKPRKHKKVVKTPAASPSPPLSASNHEDWINKYSREANENESASHSSRRKRATRGREEIKNTCSLYIQTDPLIWRHIREGFPEHADPRKEYEVNEKTREEILSLIAHHVTAVNYIYRDTKFDGRSEHRNIKFEVQRIKVRRFLSKFYCSHL